MLDADLKKVAKKAGVDLPDRPNAAQRATAATLRGLSGADFDKAWLDAQVLSHRKAAADGRTEQTKGSNDDVVTVAKKSAPVIEDHLRRLLDAKDDAKKDDASTATHDSGTSSDQEKGGDDHPAAKSGDCPDAKHAA
jgi:predicted outer membrane protein